MTGTPGLTEALLAGFASGTVEIVDLTQPLSETTPLLVLPEPFANTPPLTRRRISHFDEDGPGWAWNVLEVGEHNGTHLDAPVHWATGSEGKDVASIDPHRLVGPAVVLDRTAEVARDPGYLLSVDDLLAFETAHGRIPDGAWLLFRTGWASRVHDTEAFLNIGPDGSSQTPGPSAAAARWLATERGISGFGVETVGIDAGAAPTLEPPFPAHHYLLGHDRYGLTQLANLDKLPTTGAVIVVAPLKLVGGTGAPTRVLAFVQTG